MKILVIQTPESVTFTLPDGATIEITMVNVYGEDVAMDNDVNEAFRILKDDLKYFAADISGWNWHAATLTSAPRLS